MKKYEQYDAIVIGAGHAGCEAGLACARTGLKTLITTLNLDGIGFLPCNPSIGGTAKGHLVFEIDALGGEMGYCADKATIHRRMLNETKGPAVHSLRAQVDKVRYHEIMKSTLEKQENLTILQAEVADIIVKQGKLWGIKTAMGEKFKAKTVIVCTGVYLNSRTLTGKYIKDSGPNGFTNATKLTASLKRLGLNILRFKTGTPMRIDGRTVKLDALEVQEGTDNLPPFSKNTTSAPKNVAKCYMGYTNEGTHEIIRKNLHYSPLYQGVIKGVGPRYCPSIEDKIVRFADKDRHQFFLEPESLSTNEVYAQGLSSSLPYHVQQDIIHSIKGLENAHLMRYAYAIEYDCIDSTALDPTLQYKNIKGLFFAGQINGSSGYEEAAAQGIYAGINASLYVRALPPLILKRNDAYIGVLVDDLVTKGTNEPYRMMTSRAEYRLLLRQDNADLRLTQLGYNAGLVTRKNYNKLLKKRKDIQLGELILDKTLPPTLELQEFLKEVGEPELKTGIQIRSLLKRNTIDIFNFNAKFHFFDEFSLEIQQQLNIIAKYEGYIKIQEEQISRQQQNENIEIPADFDYNTLKGLRIEARQKLQRIQPLNIAQASRISGVSPADITILIIYLKKHRTEEN
ncbi:MAG: tRNA uridine-5-carboxymethylaminomethyl(34) synthesis enzyme MnmG [Clostridia bacterium]|nr:tRNA uridine-5-carboxymethylaminomethyl(34) synthesis enzyme MnmG [Clostridia bacterium]